MNTAVITPVTALPQPRHRYGVAAAMVVVLAAALAAAVTLSRSRQEERWPALLTHVAGQLEFQRPAKWRMGDLPADHPAILQPLGVFTEPGVGGRKLTAYKLQNGSAIAPDSALYLTLGLLEPEAVVTAGSIVRSETMLGRIIYGQPQRGSGEKLVMAACTLDGKLYLILHLGGLGRVNAEDMEMMRRLAQTAQDRGFEVETGPLHIGRVEVKMPEDLRALRRRDQGDEDPLLITPVKTGDFRFLKVGDERLTDVERLLQSRGPTPMPEPLAAVIRSAKGPDDLLTALLAVRYWQATGKPPPPRSLIPFPVSNHVALASVLSGTSSSTYRGLWAVRLDEEHAVVIQLVAEPVSVNAVHRDAAMLLRGMGIEAQAPDPGPESRPQPQPATPSQRPNP